MNLLTVFRGLPLPATGVFSGAKVGTNSIHRVARNDSGRPCLLIASSGGIGQFNQLRLEYLEVRPNVACRIDYDGQIQQETFALLAFSSDDPLLQRYFLQVGETLLATLPAQPASSEIMGAVYRMAEVLRQLSLPPRKSVQGLWAELLLILESQRIQTLVGWWHSKPSARYDFDGGKIKIEVKSSSGSEREHYFSLEQLFCTEGQVYVASILVRQSQSGSSIMDLRDKIANYLESEPALVHKVDMVIASTLGRSLPENSEARFDAGWSKRSLRCCQSHQIPHIKPENVPVGVNEVKFKANLGNLKLTHGIAYLQQFIDRVDS